MISNHPLRTVQWISEPFTVGRFVDEFHNSGLWGTDFPLESQSGDVVANFPRFKHLVEAVLLHELLNVVPAPQNKVN